MSAETFSGGCQCGAVRYTIAGRLSEPHICHCRMCQKAAGNFFMPLAGTEEENVAMTRGAPRWFQSSDPIRRGFCEACGTPLFYQRIGSGRIAVALGSLDDPAAFPPETQEGCEGRVPFFHELAGLPGAETYFGDAPALLDEIASSSHQHPDHDTDRWPEPTR
ncbi:GFA family protein [Martelella endophytica]|uniref:Aldehyde-activating protein n=1 Tax=Martelella endophytica TaxID=1486262 RepID=A0A0D5LTC0_MAREN|nr:GFA family protein [Martelella endophytica]AJY46618.1 aldehyde-activating protein [Martelella endophytica]